MEYNHCSALDIKDRGIGCNGNGDFTNTGNWTTNVQTYTTTGDMFQIHWCISFDKESTADGGSDGQLTLSEALNALYNEYVSSGIGMPSSYTVDGNAGITVSNCHCCSLKTAFLLFGRHHITVYHF
jgi:hypothetical protein